MTRSSGMYSTSSKIKQAMTRGAQIAIVVVIIILIAGGGYAAVLLSQTHTTTTSTGTTTTTSTTSTTSTSTTSTTSTSHSTTTSTSSQQPPTACVNTPYTTTPASTGYNPTVTSTTVAPPSVTPYTSGTVPSSLTYWYTNSFQYLDPGISYYEQDYSIISSVYEPLLFYNGTSGTQTVPWLVQNYTVSKDGTTANFTLRQGITFQDGEQLNSTAVYFTFNRLLAFDGSSPTSHGTQASWIIQQLVDPCLSTFLGGTANYTSAYVNAWLANNFVQITGPYTFTLHIQHPNAALPFLLAGDWASILAPDWVMTNDVALWHTQGYTLPNYPLTGSGTTEVNNYLMDLVATCNAGPTPTGCGATSLIANSASLASGSNYAPLAGTGPYEITSFNYGTGAFTMKANPTYWGGGYQGAGAQFKTNAHIQTVQLNYETSQATRETDLLSSANAGQAATIDLASTNLYDLADKTTWNGGAGTLVPNSNWAGKIFFTPASGYTTLASFFYPFSTNVTNPQTGTYYSFQPFADQRIRLAFADSVNMTEINADYNNGLGSVANSVFPPGLPPAGSYNKSAALPYSYNPDEAANLMLQAMEHPITSFTFANGTAAPSGVFSNVFGCSALVSGTCANPVKQQVVLSVAAGDPVDLAAFNVIANTIDNISTTYNMGLTVSVQVLPLGTLYSQEAAGELYLYFAGWIADYPWVVDFSAPMLAYPGTYTTGTGMNFPYLNQLEAQAVKATETDNVTGLVTVARLMDEFATQQVMYLYTFYTLSFNIFTTQISPSSVVQNPALGYALYQNLY